MPYTIISSPLMVEVVLPFVLVFVLIFAILQKTEVLGKGKKQIDALIALAIGLIVVAFGYATHIILSLIPFLAVASVVILVFLLLYGMTFEAGKFEIPGGARMAIGILAAVGVVIATLVATGGWDYLYDLYLGSADGSTWITNALIVAFVVVGFFVLTRNEAKSDKK